LQDLHKVIAINHYKSLQQLKLLQIASNVIRLVRMSSCNNKKT